MSSRELRALGISFPATIAEPTTSSNTAGTTIPGKNFNGTSMTTVAVQVNPYHGYVGLSLAEGKKLHQKVIEGLLKD